MNKVHQHCFLLVDDLTAHLVRQVKVSRKRENTDQLLEAIRLRKVFVPVVIGVAVVGYLMYRQFDYEELSNISWTSYTLVWILMGVVVLIGRILAYSIRLQILSVGSFSLWKSIQLIFIWFFSSAISPTNVGGAAVALVVLAQEKIGAAKATSIVLYAVVLDTAFFLLIVPFWILLFGFNLLELGNYELPGYGWEISLGLAYTAMFIYGAFFFYGLFINPYQLRRLSYWLAGTRLLSRWQRSFRELGDDIVVASKELTGKPLWFHLRVAFFTVLAWTLRYSLIICLYLAVLGAFTETVGHLTELFAQIQLMYLIMAFSPTPGGAGFAEVIFGVVLNEYLPQGVTVFLAFLWRLMAYYFFLLMGVIVIPGWIAGRIEERKQKMELKKEKINRSLDPKPVSGDQ